ncbi:hypothetical protein AC1031_007592 [Aphanomyces cochlioides]|nr:hypothetical protein AC1031_007592 [Aphanomyces cochlioides]
MPIAFDHMGLRPPLPRLPKEFDFFVAISSYRDGVRCGYAVWTAFARAANPERIFLGIVDQTQEDDPKCLDEYCRRAKESWPNDDCKYKDHIKIDALNAKNSKGPAVARSRQAAMMEDQEFCMSIDAHTQFVYDWDKYIVEDFKRTENEMAVLTTYPLSYYHLGPNFTLPTVQSRHLCMYGKRELPGDIPILWPTFITNSERPQLQAFWGGGMSFSKCHAERRAPIDGHLTWVFMGEEYRAWLSTVHNYTGDNTGTKPDFFENAKNNDARPLEELKGYNRLRSALKFPFQGEMDGSEMEKYYGGSVRTLEQYLEFSKVSNVDPVHLDDWPCEQLHGVPYAVPEIIEQLLPGWKMRPSLSPFKNEDDASVDTKNSLNKLQTDIDAIKQRLDGGVTTEHIETINMQLKSLLERSENAAAPPVPSQGDNLIETLLKDEEAKWQAMLDQQHQDMVTITVIGSLLGLTVLIVVWTTRNNPQSYEPVAVDSALP